MRRSVKPLAITNARKDSIAPVTVEQMASDLESKTPRVSLSLPKLENWAKSVSTRMLVYFSYNVNASEVE